MGNVNEVTGGAACTPITKNSHLRRQPLAMPHKPKAEKAALCLKLLEKQFSGYDYCRQQLQDFVRRNKNRGRSVGADFRAEVLQRAFNFFGQSAGADGQNIISQLAKTHPSVCLAYYSPVTCLDFLQLFLSEGETFKLLITHIIANAHFGAIAIHIQGIAESTQNLTS